MSHRFPETDDLAVVTTVADPIDIAYDNHFAFTNDEPEGMGWRVTANCDLKRALWLFDSFQG